MQRISQQRKKIICCTSQCQNTIINEKGIFINSKARCCVNHLINKLFTKESLKLLKSKYIETSFNRTDIVTLLENVRKTLALSSCLNFENVHLLSDSVCYSLTGITKENFEDIVSHLSTLRNSSVRTINTCMCCHFTDKAQNWFAKPSIGCYIFSLQRSDSEMYSQWKELFDERFCTPTHWISTYIT